MKAIEDDPHVLRKKTARALASFMSLHKHNIEQETEDRGVFPFQGKKTPPDESEPTIFVRS